MKLAQVVHDYISLKQSLGSRFHTEATILKSFCNALGEVTIVDVEPHQVNSYLSGSGPVTLFWHRKYEALSGFYRFVLGRGYVLHSPLPMIVPKRPQPFRPYIYSQQELHDLLKATGEYETPRTTIEEATLRTLLLLLYGAGLRIGEALALTYDDVNLDAALLTIRESKFYKTRLVPIGLQLTAVLRTYADDRYQHGHSAPFFITRTGTAVTRGLAERAFVRLHDLRHSMAVHRLVAWYREGANVQRLLPQLATYLGHINVASTQRYLTMTPDLLHEASQRFMCYAQPEAHHG